VFNDPNNNVSRIVVYGIFTTAGDIVRGILDQREPYNIYYIGICIRLESTGRARALTRQLKRTITRNKIYILVTTGRRRV